MMEKSSIRKLAEFIHDLTWEQIPLNVQEAAALRVLDLVSVAAGASSDPLVHQVAASGIFQEEGGRSSVWGWKETYSLPGAVMLNAMLAHTLELDDVHPASKTHGSASLIPAAWSCAEYLGSTGKEFLTAVVCGYETVNRIGMAFGVSSHRNRGWHATATCGVFGCAAACGKLLNLDVDQIVSALGMAGTQSSGVWAFLGDRCNCKILHTGRAAVNGLEAAFLARAGMTGPEHILEAEDGGLLRAMSDGGDGDKVSEGLGTVWEILNMDRKPYPCCRSTHCAVDCALGLRDKVDLEHVVKIRIQTYLVGYKQCGLSQISQKPRTPVHARFSTPYTVACAILYGEVTLRQFRPEMICDPAVQSLLKRVTVEAADEFTRIYPAHWGCRVRIHDIYEKVYETCVKDASGSVARPLGQEQVKAKAAALMKEVCGSQAVRIAETVLDIENLDILPQL